MKGNRMKMGNERSNGAGKGGIGCISVVGVVFVVLKLTGTGPVANWSWWWVLSPFWLQFALGFTLIALAAAGFAVFNAMRGHARKKDA